MKTLYLDLISGVSGDMFVGALLDLGVRLDDLDAGLSRLGVSGYHLHATRGQKSGITGTKFDVHLEAGSPAEVDDHADHAQEHAHEVEHHHEHGHPHDRSHGHGHEQKHGDEHDHADSRDFAEIQELINASPLSSWVKEKAVAVFRRVAEAEGKIHGLPPERVHFHEVGALDSIMDIVGACLGLELLGRPRVLASPVTEGTGWVTCAHGRFPVPTPATVEILAARGVTLSQCEEPHELVTPTGAALLAEFVERFEPLRDFPVQRVGYGLGTRDHRTRPNVLRALLSDDAAAAGESPTPTHDWETDSVAVIETNIDDLNPEILGHFAERALAGGALDVFHTPIQMKKGRPATLLTLLCLAQDSDKFCNRILTETSSFGVRITFAQRRKLRRQFRQVTTPHGQVTFKLGLLDGRVVHAAPEFESCRNVAAQAGVPLKIVYDAASKALQL